MPVRRQPSPAQHTGERHDVALAPAGTTTATIYAASVPRGVLLVLAHGAGAGQHHPFMISMATLLAARGLDVVTFDFRYLHERRKLPDRAPVLEATFGQLVDWAVAREEWAGHRLLIGGKSMGGRMATHLAAAGFVGQGGDGPPLSGVVALGYPLHPPGKPQQRRDAHLPAIAAPVLIVQGTRDTFGTPGELQPVVDGMRAASMHVVTGGDHSFAVARTPRDGVLAAVADAIVAWADSSIV
jgi:uncharacterized protein